MTVSELLRIADHLDPKGQLLVRKAFDRAAAAHDGQHRLSGEDYVNHPLEVAAILADLELDAETISAALLHDTVEDTNLTADEVKREFGPEVARLVDGVTKLGRISLRTDQQQQAENIRKMMVAMAEDLRVVLIKLADRLHNMRTLAPLAEPKRRKISRETLDIYAPLAHRLGIGQIKWELEDLAFRNLEPEAFEDVVRRIARKRDEREKLVSDLREILARELEKLGIQADITGRPKHIYSVWQKMTREDKDFSEIYDLSAIRVQVDSVRDCYGVLGVVHSLWKPMPGRFKDYIAMPKSNGYQSLHTTVITHTGEPIEIQIRTHEMHRVAEFGVAAHWTYKEGGKDASFDQKLSWLRSLLEWQNEVGDAESFLNTVKVDLFQDEVYVFTPRGDVINLPADSTPVDFAYRIHTEVGHHCIGAKVNGRMVPLDYELKNGEIVEILTSKGPHGPSRDWLNFVKSASAKERIRKWFKSQRREENVAKGHDLLDKELHRMHRVSLSDLPEPKLLEIANLHKYPTVDDFMAAIGYGDLSPHAVVMRMSLNLEAPGGDLRTIPLIPQVQPSPRVLVHGERGILTSIATCCQPVPGDAIVGYTTRGRGVTVHRADCINAVNAQDSARVVSVDWDMDATHLYPVAIKIEAWDRQGLMRDIATVVAENRVNMSALEVHVYDDKTAVVSATVEIDSLAQLSRLMEKLEGVKDVHTVAREAS
ncbi:MAG: bifunctional (p)ppGpp synthetase/guanosine-3',5'-bis(diphosphate) 3'-pyrophosphohydrolase [Chloroflexi bacterium]|nr:MAG: bifunctional (p)ppGpp synthetase/guanosine-3',5'-bis(diphosphate) 3'-pyrophosphohydrolase [Chloroflexota bacterium]TMG58737.1 MAG: bifunctional (p)ppGpp synthetase/guanosine-3',5'-bis(diphosphate) 3'-pyrophosphohydrolase [Chloroflexota bacterium]